MDSWHRGFPPRGRGGESTNTRGARGNNNPRGARGNTFSRGSGSSSNHSGTAFNITRIPRGPEGNTGFNQNRGSFARPRGNAADFGGPSRGRGTWRGSQPVTGARGATRYPRFNTTENTFMTAAKFKEFLGKDADSVIMAFHEAGKSFERGIEKNMDTETLHLFVQVLGVKICGNCAVESIRNTIISKACIPTFLNQLKDMTFQCFILGPTPETYHLISNLYSFYRFVNEKMPNTAADRKIVDLVAAACKLLSQIPDSSLLEDLKNKCQALKEHMDEFKAKRDEELQATGGGEKRSTAFLERRMRELELRWMEAPPEDFRSLPIIPTVTELLSEEKPYLRPSLTKGKFPSVEEYLDVHYRLLREDFVEPIREGIRQFYKLRDGHNHKRPPPGTVKIYRRVQLKPGLSFQTSSPSYTLKLDMDHFLRKVKWDRSKRLLNGSLLLLTQDDFSTIYFATVCRRDVRDLGSTGTFCIIWEGNKPHFQAEAYFTMLECDIFFETYRHTLHALTQLKADNFPMEKYIVHATSEQASPPYLLAIEEALDFKILMPSSSNPDIKNADDYGLANLLDTSSWPSTFELGMDESQYGAFQAALTQEFSIIQGPPGTGKTFIGIQIAKFLLANKRHFFPSVEVDPFEDEDLLRIGSPVLVVCYTNHALDQFLEAIRLVIMELGLKPENELMRVGGQTKSEAMQDLLMFRRLNDAVKQRTLPSSYLNMYHQASHTLRKIKHKRYTLVDTLRSSINSDGIVDLEELRQFLEDEGYLPKNEMQDHISQLLRAFHKCKNAWKHFGFENRVYNLSNFKNNERVEAIFKCSLREEPVPSEKIQTDEGEAADEDNENENYDLTELMENRIEELEYEVSDVNGKRCPVNYKIGPYDFQASLTQNRQDISNCNRILSDPNFSDELYRQAHDGIAYAQSQITRYENIRGLLRRILRSHKERLLQLPPVTVKMVNETRNRFENCGSNTNEHFRENWTVYFHCLDKFKGIVLKEILKLEEELLKQSKVFKDLENYGYSQLLKRVKFVGATTTGAAKYNTILRMIKSKMVIIEEAAEVLESHIVTSITKDCEHLVLIGDHFQLRPKTTVYRLGKDFNLDVSLFERMINNQMNSHMLQIQHRMRPEICDLLVPTIYQSLENHASVETYPNVKGMSSNLFFIKHSEAEESVADSTSRSNKHEARFLARLCRHLILQGYVQDRITILTTYVGQMFLIKKVRACRGVLVEQQHRIISNEEQTCMGVRVTAVDNYQGEENDIILLSLVRSNEENQIGFLKTDNRVCVAISRAKHGFYVIGNMDSMEASSPTWKKITEKLAAKYNIGTHLSLKCFVHGDITLVEKPDDFRNAPEGGCARNCSASLPKCAHKCQLVCHIRDIDHVEYKCRLPCDRKCSKQGHDCPGKCFQDPCPTCVVLVTTKLSCDHIKDLACHIDADLYKCLVRVTRKLPACEHELEMDCCDEPSKFSCKVTVPKSLPCSHIQDAYCYEPVETIACRTLVTRNIPDCKHDITLACYVAQRPSEHWNCESKCDTRLECGHACVKKCHVKNDPDHDNYKCQKECSRKCPNDHKCMKGYEHKHKCHSACPPCPVELSAKLPCQHMAQVSCSDSRDDQKLALKPCGKMCSRILPCGHPCPKKCKEECGPCMVEVLKKSVDCIHYIKVPCSEVAEKKRCATRVEPKVRSACGHGVVKVSCSVEDTVTPEDCMAFCEAPCGQALKLDGVGCDHQCTGTCSSCYNGRMHVKCRDTCGRVLVCGHTCKSPCSAVCPPCNEPCSMSCEHSKCKRRCGEPCSTCKERCGWKCEHLKCKNLCGEKCNREACMETCKISLPCSHPCVGLCNEPCPPLCAICNKDELTEIFLGNEDEEGARFVLLEDCGHCFEVSDLDKWMSLDSETEDNRKGVLVRRCPLCKTIVGKSRRYDGILKDCMKDVLEIKKKIYGEEKKSATRVAELVRRLETVLTKGGAENELNFFSFFISMAMYKNPRDFYETVANQGRKRNGVLKKVDQYTLESLGHMMNWWEDSSVSKDKLKKPLRDHLVGRYIRLFRIVKSRGMPLSNLEIKQFNMEFRRLADLYELYRRGSTEVVEDPSCRPAYDLVKNVVDNVRCYTLASETVFKLRLSELDLLLKANFEQQQIGWRSAFQAIAAQATSWYKCRCGHLYAVGDCGQLNQAGQCPKCKSGIGGASGSMSVRVADAHRAPNIAELGPGVNETLEF